VQEECRQLIVEMEHKTLELHETLDAEIARLTALLVGGSGAVLWTPCGM
jgi:hypothetical protein